MLELVDEREKGGCEERSGTSDQCAEADEPEVCAAVDFG
jgi:hypothetical protein